MIAVTEEGQKLREQIGERMHAPPAPIAALSPEDQRELRDCSPARWARADEHRRRAAVAARSAPRQSTSTPGISTFSLRATQAVRRPARDAPSRSHQCAATMTISAGSAPVASTPAA